MEVGESKGVKERRPRREEKEEGGEGGWMKYRDPSGGGDG